MPSNLDRYRRIAPLYDLLDLPFEYGRYRRLRRQLFAGLEGRILDAGVGTGRNMPFYPAGAEVIGIDISPDMLMRARRRQGRSPARTELREMDVTRLGFPDGSFDAVTASFLFCVLPEGKQVPALREFRRVARAGGHIRLLDYVRPRGPVRRFIAALWEPWISWAYGASFDRDPERCIGEAGLEVADTRYVVNDLIKLIEARVPDCYRPEPRPLEGEPC